MTVEEDAARLDAEFRLLEHFDAREAAVLRAKLGEADPGTDDSSDAWEAAWDRVSAHIIARGLDASEVINRAATNLSYWKGKEASFPTPEEL